MGLRIKNVVSVLQLHDADMFTNEEGPAIKHGSSLVRLTVAGQA